MEKKLIGIFEDILNDNSITLDTDRGSVETWDSLAQIQLIGEIENEFGISFSFDETDSLCSVRDFYDYIVRAKR